MAEDTPTPKNNAASEKLTPQQVEDMQRQLAAYHAEQAAADAAKKAAKMAPLTDVTTSAAFAEVYDKLQTAHLTGAFLGMDNVDSSLRGLLTIMPLLKDAVGRANA